MIVRTLHLLRSVRGKLFSQSVAILAPFVVLGILWMRDATMAERGLVVSRIDERANRVVASVLAIAQEETTVLRTIGELPPLEDGIAGQMEIVLSAMLPHYPLVNNFYALEWSSSIPSKASASSPPIERSP